MLLHLQYISELICKSTKSTHFRASFVYSWFLQFACLQKLQRPYNLKPHFVTTSSLFKSKTRSCFSFWSLQKPWTTFPISKLQRPKIKLSHFNQIFGPPIRSPNVSQRTWKLGLESPPWKLERNKRHNFLIKPQVNQGFLQNKNHLTTPRALIKDQKSH